MSIMEHRPRGMYFEELEIGQKMVSPGRTMTEADIVQFCGLSGDYNELHSNAEYAQHTVFGQRVVHGLLGLAVASGLAGRLGFMEGTAQAFMGLDWKFKRPIFIGDTIAVQAVIKSKKEVRRLGGGIVVVDVAVLNQRQEIVQQGEWTVLIKSWPTA